MNQGDKSVKERIIFATIECIEEKGINAVTTRSIASKANVNNAAINYYFGTKEKLLEETLNSAAQHAILDLSEIMSGDNIDCSSIMQSFFTYIFQGMIRYPNLVKAYLYNPIINNDYQSVFVKRQNVLLGDLTNKVSKLVPESEENDIRISLMQMLASIIFCGILPDFFKEFLDIDFKDTEKQRMYVSHLIKSYNIQSK